LVERRVDQADYDLLEMIEKGRNVFQPTDHSVEGRVAFQHMVDQLLRLRSVGFVRLPEGRVMRAQDGSYLMAGPCDLTPAGIAALAKDRSLGPRPPQGGAGRLWRKE
jgi:hypothetical protein